jgi:hypothetical protein
VQRDADGTGNLDRTIALRGGGRVTLRHIRPADSDLLMDLYSRLSPGMPATP